MFPHLSTLKVTNIREDNSGFCLSLGEGNVRIPGTNRERRSHSRREAAPPYIQMYTVDLSKQQVTLQTVEQGAKAAVPDVRLLRAV